MRHFVLAGLAAAIALPAIAIPAFSQSLTVQPGQWEASTVLRNIDAPGLPPQVLKMMQNRPAAPFRYCLTPEDAENGPKRMLEESQRSNGECKTVKYDISGNRLDAEIQCNSGEMGNARILAKGEYNATSYRIDMDMESSGGPFRRMSSTIEAKRVGSC